MKEKKGNNKGAIILLVCGFLTLLLIVGCVFFPDQIFGLISGK